VILGLIEAAPVLNEADMLAKLRLAADAFFWPD
jgi:hypothetical protein